MKKIIKPLSLVLATSMIATSCGDTKETGSSDSGAVTNTDGTATYSNFITVDVFNSMANYQGTQAGWFGKIVKDKFNMELNIIAPNVAGGGDTLYQTRVATGDLGDLILAGAGDGRLNDLAKYGLLYDMSGSIGNYKNLTKYQSAIDSMNKDLGGVYAIPIDVSSKAPTEPIEVTEPSFAPYIRWDLYAQLGYPEVKTFNDLLSVLKDMQALEPKTESGKNVYAISMFGDWDGNMMMYAKQPICMYGYDEMGFALASADGSDIQDILQDDGLYKNSLQFFFDANQLGLVDPESTTQNWDMLYSKFEEGAVLFSPWSWLGQSAYNTMERKEAGKGFMALPAEDMSIFSYGANPNGTASFYAIGSKAEDPERLMDFMDWIYSPEGVYSVNPACSGPQGLAWDIVDGKPELTEFGMKAKFGTDAVVPEEWGGGTWDDGVAALYSTVQSADIDPNTGETYAYISWPSVIEATATSLDENWQAHMNAISTVDYLKQHDLMTTAPGSGYIAPAESSEISTIRGQVKAIIVEYSWRAVFAKNQAEFDALFAEMQKTAKGLGYDQVLEFDMQCANDQAAARAAAAK